MCHSESIGNVKSIYSQVCCIVSAISLYAMTCRFDVIQFISLETIFRYSGILSAYGIALADVVHEAQEPAACEYNQGFLSTSSKIFRTCCNKLIATSSSETIPKLDLRLENLIVKCKEELRHQGFSDDLISVEPFLNLRYDRTNCALMCSGSESPVGPKTSRYGDFLDAFTKRFLHQTLQHLHALFCSNFPVLKGFLHIFQVPHRIWFHYSWEKYHRG